MMSRERGFFTPGDDRRSVTTREWLSLSHEIKSSINLAASPIGVSLLTSAKDLLAYDGVRLLTKTVICQMAAMARYYRQNGVVGASSEGIRCLLGLSCLGLVRTPARVREGALNERFTCGIESSRKLNESIKMLGNEGKRYGAIMVGPLDLLPSEPQVIALYVTPAQALRLTIGFVYGEGEAIDTTITGQGSLCAAIAKSLDEKSIVVDIPCVGDRAYGFVQEQEMLVTFPAEKVGQLVEGLRETKKAASHPFEPFLNWPPIIWPEFEPRDDDLK